MFLSTLKTGCRLLIAGAGFALSLAVSPANAATAECSPTAMRSLMSMSQITTTSTNFVNVNGTAIRVKQGGKKPGCITIAFSAEASAGVLESMFVQATVDGVAAPCQPQYQHFAASNAVLTGLSVHGANFICTEIPAGAHTIKIQYRSGNGGTVTLGSRSTIVHYEP